MGVERELSDSDVDSDGSEDEAQLSRGEKLFTQSDLASCVLQRKAVLRCRLCPKITCLNEEVMKLHLKSKRHARAEKQMKEGRLKYLLNSDGEIEEEAETHAERHARVLAASAQAEVKKKNSKGGRQRQKMRKKRKEIKENTAKEKEIKENVVKEKENTESRPKKKQKTETKEMKGSKKSVNQAN